MNKYMVHGYFYGPGEPEVDKNGYIHFWDVIEADSEQEAKQMAAEDYGDYNYIEVHGVAKNKAQEKVWLARNPD